MADVLVRSILKKGEDKIVCSAILGRLAVGMVTLKQSPLVFINTKHYSDHRF
jgi:hypothetical protein